MIFFPKLFRSRDLGMELLKTLFAEMIKQGVIVEGVEQSVFIDPFCLMGGRGVGVEDGGYFGIE